MKKTVDFTITIKNIPEREYRLLLELCKASAKALFDHDLRQGLNEQVDFNNLMAYSFDTCMELISNSFTAILIEQTHQNNKK